LRGHRGTRLTTEQDNDRVRLGGDEAEKKDILCAAVVAFEDRVSERRGWVQLDLLVATSNQVVDDVGGRSVASGAAEPLVASQALDDASWIVDSTIAVGSVFLV
jgi:hypothetical protein